MAEKKAPAKSAGIDEATGELDPQVALAAAMVAAAAEIETIAKGEEATVPTKGGGSYTYRYADLSSIMEAIRPILARHGLAVFQEPETEWGQTDGTLLVGCTTRIVHEAGAYRASRLLLPCPGRTDAKGTRYPPGPQDVGACITYARRYALAALGVVTEEDDDAQGPQANARGGAPPAAPSGPTQPQLKRWWAKVKDATNGDRGLAEELYSQAKKRIGMESITTATREQYEAACAFADSWPPEDDPRQMGSGGEDDDIPF